MDSNKNSNQIRVLMFPWLAYGHISPYLELAKKLSTRNFVTYLCSTPPTLSCVEKTITPELSESIKVVPLHLPTSPNLPKHLHTTNGLPPHLMSELKEALDKSEPDFSNNILGKIKPGLLIYDILQPWVATSAKKLNIPAVLFNTSSSTSVSYMFHYFIYPSTKFPYPSIYFRDYEAYKMKELLECDPKDKANISEGFEKSCDIILIKGFREIEGKYMDYGGSLLGKKFVVVGPLVQEPTFDNNIIIKNYHEDDIFAWLEKKKTKSTVFISFGSEYYLSDEDISEIAHGLEISEVNFIWVLRFPKGTNGVPKTSKLPQGFEERVGERGKVVEGWAPQTKILEHSNVGGFVSHCGWNSVMESMSYGVPIIAMPMHLDQPLNARLVEEVGVGIEVLRDENGKISGDNLSTVIKEVVVEDCGEVVRKRAGEMRDKIKEDRDEETDEVVKELLALCSKS